MWRSWIVLMSLKHCMAKVVRGRPDPRPKISGPNGPEIFGLGSGLGPALGSGLGARLGSAPRLTLLPRLQFFLPTPPFALQCSLDSLVLFSTVSVLVLSHCPAYHGQFSHTASAFWGAVWDSWPPIGRMERSKGPTLHHPLHCCGPENTCGLWANALKTYNKSLWTPLY